MLRSYFEEVSARDVEVILNRHAKLEDIDGLTVDAAATSPQAKAAKAKCVTGQSNRMQCCATAKFSMMFSSTCPVAERKQRALQQGHLLVEAVTRCVAGGRGTRHCHGRRGRQWWRTLSRRWIQHGSHRMPARRCFRAAPSPSCRWAAQLFAQVLLVTRSAGIDKPSEGANHTGDSVWCWLPKC